MATPEDIATALGTFYEQKIGPRFDRIDAQFDRIDARFERVEEQFDRVEGQFDRIRDEMARMGQDLRGEIAGSEARLRGEIDEFRRDVDAHFDALYQRLDKLETEYQMITVALRRLEAAADQDRQDRQALQAEVADLRARVNELGERLAELESRLSPP